MLIPELKFDASVPPARRNESLHIKLLLTVAVTHLLRFYFCLMCSSDKNFFVSTINPIPTARLLRGIKTFFSFSTLRKMLQQFFRFAASICFARFSLLQHVVSQSSQTLTVLVLRAIFCFANETFLFSLFSGKFIKRAHSKIMNS